MSKEKEQKPGVEQDSCCCHRTKERSTDERQALLNRLSRIEGQIRGIRRMVEENAYCPDILVQSAAAEAALGAFSSELLNAHLHTCVAVRLREGDDSVLEELMPVLRKLMK